VILCVKDWSAAVGVPPGAAPTIAALAADGTTVLESYDLFALAPIETLGGVNAGAFRGIWRAAGDIAYLRISGSFILMHDLTVVAAVPEPATAGLVALALAGLAAWRKRWRCAA
jgi:hypothetical protein